MHFTVMGKQTYAHQQSHAEAMAQGLKACGHTVTVTGNQPVAQSKHVACWGWRIGKILRDQGHEVLVMERGYLGDRHRYTSLAWNGLNGYGTFPEIKTDTSRFAKIDYLKNWNESGEYILIMGQVPGDQSLKGVDLTPWYQKMAKEAFQHYKLHVLFRPHPLAHKRGGSAYVTGTIPSLSNLRDALAKAKLVITFNSNSAVDAVIAGAPTMTFDMGSMAWDVSSHDVKTIVMPDREEWINRLAWRQWELEEIRSGFAVEKLLSICDA